MAATPFMVLHLIVFDFNIIMETKRNFDGAVQHASVRGRDNLLLKKKQVEVLEVRLLRVVTDRLWQSLCYQLIPFLCDYKRGWMNAPKAELSVVIVVSWPLIRSQVSSVVVFLVLSSGLCQ